MKKLVLALFVSLFAFSSQSQNLQTHYDFGKDRGYLTTTVEMFKPDKFGNTFFFIDFDYGVGDMKGVSLAYMEFARCIKLGKSPFSWHAEYNGGFGKSANDRLFAKSSKDGKDVYSTNPLEESYQINNAWLTGIDYSWNAKDFSHGFSLKALFKTIQNKNDASFQLTGVWYVNMLKNKVTFSGFADFWKEDNDFFLNAPGKATKFVFLSEPQLWYNFCKNFAAGGEVEIASNFALHKGFKACPTLGMKYTF
jgi:hypothetical protein